ncbi:ABC transporter substrate-binding protein [Mangrovicella endophytica]|uniref:ABC transporter substrate-binding protein n=1 Tax=Mangrovicella endophytica TaxID=2066697 RepID=UPI0018E48981|nr:ABC transporter substrate-binding protein [Mangrovicella endophytica]
MTGQAFAQDKTLNIVDFGGAFEAAAISAWLKPFAEEQGVKFANEQYDGGVAKLRAMVEAGNTTWDLIDLETNDAITGCDEGLLQKLDPKLLGDTSDFIEGAVLPCAVASMIWSTVYAYDTTKLTTAPTSINDFFDTEKFPGKRGMRKTPKVALEWALLADGVPAADVYKQLGTDEGVDKALKKLSTIKDSIVWWEAGSQPPQLLADGAVAMTMVYNGRIYDAQKKENKPFAIVWDGQVYDYEWWGIPTGAPDTDLAQKFVEYASSADNIWKLSNHIAYAPPRKSSVEKIDKAVLGDMPTAPDNFKNALQIDAEFWADNYDSINSRFMTWLGQ